MTLQLRVVAHSEVGLVRKNNQDSGYASVNLLVVADGMGGAAAGDLASAVAIDTIRKVDTPTTGNEMLEVLAGALHRANDRIADLVDADHTLEGMGTTVTGVLFDGSTFGLAHIGDSRAYLLHDDRLERLTHDHTWVQSLVDEGRIDESEAAVHPHRSLLLKVLNGQPGSDPDLTLVRVTAGDRLMLCSDGLCGIVDDAAIQEALRVHELDAAMQALVDEALAEGGVDNITVIVAEVIEADQPVDGALARQSLVLGAATERKIPPVETRGRPLAADSAGKAGADLSEDTLISTDPVTDPVTESREPPRQVTAEDESRYNPQPPRKRRFGRAFVGLLALVLIAAAGLGAAYAWTRTQFYVGASSEKVAIFRGLSEGLPGISLSRLYEVQPLAVSALPPYYQEKVRATIDVANLSAARQTVIELTEAAKRCASQTPPAQKPTATPPATPKTSDSPKPAVSGKPTASVRPTPLSSPSDTATIEVSC